VHINAVMTVTSSCNKGFELSLSWPLIDWQEYFLRTLKDAQPSEVGHAEGPLVQQLER
jgi:hypothetical protein